MNAQQVSKEFVLGRVTPEEIFEHYLGVPVRLNERGSSESFCSPIRPDRHPTCSYFLTRWDALYFKDQAGYITGDCFKLVEHIHGISFGEAVRKIAYDMRLVEGELFAPRKKFERNLRAPSFAEYSTMGIKPRKWNMRDKKYWGAYPIKRSTLDHFRVFPVQVLVVDGRIKYMYDPQDPAYAYYFGNQKFKIYWPYRKLWRFICNTDLLQGLKQFRPLHGGINFITKSLKDVMVLYELEYPAVAPQGEGHTLPEKFLEKGLKEDLRFVLFYDNDEAGIEAVNIASKRYDLDYIMLPSELLELEIKDISDYVKAYGHEAGKEIIESLI